MTQIYRFSLTIIGVFFIAASTPTSFGQSEPHYPPGSLVAIMDMQGFRGSIEFHSNPTKLPFEEVIVRINIIGPLGNDRLNWAIWENPVDLSQKDPCNKEKLGKELANLSGKYGYIRTGREVLFRDTYNSLGVSTIFERTLVIQSIRYGLKACTLIRSSVPVATYEARFLSPISGNFVIRQLPDIATGIRANLLWTNSISQNSKLQWSLVKVDHNPNLQLYENSLLQERTCSHLWELISSDLTVPLFRSGTSMPIKVGGGQHPKSQTFAVETNFTSMEAMDIKDVWVILQWSVDEFIACAPLWIVHPREAIAELKQPAYAQGFVHFYQSSAYGDATVVTVNLTLPKRNAAGFGIDELTLPTKQGFRQQCTALSLSYFNPMQIEPEASPVPLAGTTDRYSIGDLGGKMGTLLDRNKMQATFYNQYLTLHGANGIIGRSIALYEDSWYPLACANLQTGSKELIASAKFDGAITGLVSFQQHLEEPLGAHTTIHVDLRHKAQDNSTLNHKWRIHVFRKHTEHTGQQDSIIQQQQQNKDTSELCQTIGSVYNPYGVTISNGYTCGCSQETAARCAIGDLSGRLGTINLAESKEAAEILGKDLANGHFFVDTGLWLNGDFSVIGLILVIYGPEYSDEILSCANIELKGS